MWWDDIWRIQEYSFLKYPMITGSDERSIELRCFEILAYENVIRACMDNPLKNPRDILEEYYLYLIGASVYFNGRPKRKENYTRMKRVIFCLIKELK